MLLSKTSQYAIQALIYLATQNPRPRVLNKETAQKLGIPQAYLAKIMQVLCAGGLVASQRGCSGGFRLNRAAEEISLMHVLKITEGEGLSTNCLLGLKECKEETACPMHDQWVPVKREIIEMLNQQTLATLRDAVMSGQYRICDITEALMGSPFSTTPVACALP